MDNPLRGILLIIAATICFSTSDVMAKVLGATMPTIELAWIRYIVFVVMAGAMVWHSKSPVSVRNPGMQVVRGLGLVGSALFFVQSLRSMPLAEAATIGFVSPVLITILSVPFLGEKVNARRWAAVIVGLLGVMVVVRPGGAAFQPAAFWGISSSLAWSVAVILTRKMSGGNAATMLLWTSLTGLAVLTLLLPWAWVQPSTGQVAFGALMGVVATSGQFLMVHAYRHAAASLLAPFSYGQLLWAVLGGWVVFAALPDIWTLVGGSVIAASGVAAVRSGRATATP
jgi:drug/metabolite transporter (DMT)-like permease